MSGFVSPVSSVAVPQHDELAGAVEGQRPEQGRFDDGEEGGVGADPEGQRQDGGRREGRFPPEDPQRLAHVMGLHGLLGRRIRGGCLVRGRGEHAWGRAGTGGASGDELIPVVAAFVCKPAVVMPARLTCK